jgi:hypothetical protein
MASGRGLLASCYIGTGYGGWWIQIIRIVTTADLVGLYGLYSFIIIINKEKNKNNSNIQICHSGPP